MILNVQYVAQERHAKEKLFGVWIGTHSYAIYTTLYLPAMLHVVGAQGSIYFNSPLAWSTLCAFGRHLRTNIAQAGARSNLCVGLWFSDACVTHPFRSIIGDGGGYCVLRRFLKLGGCPWPKTNIMFWALPRECMWAGGWGPHTWWRGFSGFSCVIAQQSALRLIT